MSRSRRLGRKAEDRADLYGDALADTMRKLERREARVEETPETAEPRGLSAEQEMLIGMLAPATRNAVEDLMRAAGRDA